MDRKDCFSRPPLDCSWLSRRGSGWRCSYRLAGLGFVHPIEARYLWGILFGVYLPEIGRPTPEVCARRLCQRKNLSFRTPAARAETYVPSQLVRRRRERRKAWPAWRQEPGRFASFDALVKGRGRGHPYKNSAVCDLAAKSRPKLVKICLPAYRQHPLAEFPAATYFCQQTKVCKSCFSPLDNSRQTKLSTDNFDAAAPFMR